MTSAAANLVEEYARQYAWRGWPLAYAQLPALQGARVLDLGCAIGDQSRDLCDRGATVVGVDANAELLAHAASRGLAAASFVQGDVLQPPVHGMFDGIWASFVAAYLPDPASALTGWRSLLAPHGWIALVEVSGLFEHEPMPASAKEFARRYVAQALNAGRYDFDRGQRLGAHLQDAGFEVAAHVVLPDRELSFSGPASPEVLQAWSDWLDRMKPMMAQASQECPSFRSDFLECLRSAPHRSGCKVHFWLARSNVSPRSPSIPFT